MFSTRHSILCSICVLAIFIQVGAGFEECKDSGVICHHFKSVCDTNKDAQTYCPVTCGTCPKPGACLVDNGGCAHLCKSVNDVAICSCKKGYRLHSDGKDCVDVDECAMQPPSCPRNFCENYSGYHYCVTKKQCERPGTVAKLNNPGCCTSSPQEITPETCGRNPHVDPYQVGGKIANLDVDARIVGGEIANIGAWPWMSYILINKRTLCGGTLIDSQWVLTAGHCFMNKNSKPDIEIYFGLDTVKDKKAGHVRMRKGIEVILHEKWNATKYPYRDIALIKLDKPIDNTIFIYPVCLPRGERPKPGYKCYVTGYGTTSYRGTAAKKLRQVDVPIRTDEECVRAYKKTKFPIDPSLMFCAGYDEGGKDACQGDSGGPLVCQRCESCGWYIYGVTSFGYKCAEQNYYGVYTNIEVFEEWISEKTGKPLRKDQTCDGSKKNEWSAWTQWQECSATCAGGNRTRTRACMGGATGNSGCEGVDKQSESCNIQPCPEWSKWSAWTTCSKTCGSGTRKRTRGCENGSMGERGCDNGDTLEPQKCNEQECPMWSEWSSWSECSKTCDGGLMKAMRSCVNGKQGDEGCEGDLSKSEVCNVKPCPPPTAWTEWAEWQGCSATCGGGKDTRTRICENGSPGDEGCPGIDKETKSCNEDQCTAAYDEWSEWTECSVTCGAGLHMRFRKCSDLVNPDSCVGEAQESKACLNPDCDGTGFTGQWMPWSEWGECSVSCGEGVTQRLRLCSAPTPDACVGEVFESKPCNGSCSTDNGGENAAEWSSWSSCPVTCGPGMQTRTRECPADDDGCEPQLETQPCFSEMCPGSWSEWTEFGACSQSCGNGTRARTRECQFGLIGGPGCEGEFFDTKGCYTECNVSWASWSAWTTCSQSCNGGLKSRSRSCDGGEVGDEGCSPAHENIEQVVCNRKFCSDECVDQLDSCKLYVRFNPGFCQTWKPFTEKKCMKSCSMYCIKPRPWSKWGECSRTCAGGFQLRTRVCMRADCSTTQRRPCNTEKCSGFTKWSTWAACPVTCGEGTRTRSRMCKDPPCLPDKFGLVTEDSGPCPFYLCPGAWETWQAWSQCSASCGDGTRSRKRTCIGAVVGALGCEGPDAESEKCMEEACVGEWSEWKPSSTCSATCGEGKVQEERLCVGGVAGGPGCEGEPIRLSDCLLKECVTMWSEWTSWSSCTRECGSGEQQRIRLCDNGLPGSAGCEGKTDETRECNTKECSQEMCKGLVDQAANICPIYKHLCSTNTLIKNRCELTCCKQMNGRPGCRNKLPDATCAMFLSSSLCDLYDIAKSCQKTCSSCT